MQLLIGLAEFFCQIKERGASLVTWDACGVERMMAQSKWLGRLLDVMS